MKKTLFALMLLLGLLLGVASPVLAGSKTESAPKHEPMALDERGRFVVTAPMGRTTQVILPTGLAIYAALDAGDSSSRAWSVIPLLHGNVLWVKPMSKVNTDLFIFVVDERASAKGKGSDFVRLHLVAAKPERKSDRKGEDGAYRALFLPPNWAEASRGVGEAFLEGENISLNIPRLSRAMVVLPFDTKLVSGEVAWKEGGDAAHVWSVIVLEGKNMLFVKPVLEKAKPAVLTITLKDGSTRKVTLTEDAAQPAFDVFNIR